MYAAKARGRHRFEFANPQLSRNATTLLELEGDLRRALDRHELFVQFQPLVSLDTGGLVGFEALARWRHPRRGLVPPAEFIPLAEDLGVIAAIDGWVLGEACRQVRRANSGADRPYVAVNLSPTQLASTDLRSRIDRALNDAGIEPDRLCLEVSERAVTENEHAFVAELCGLKALGVSLALDDFGAGRTSLGQLRHLPLDIVKIDRGFVQRLTNEEGDVLIVSAIVRLAHALGLTVVAEGVERPEQLLLLRDLGCDVGHGFLFAPPQHAAGFVQRPVAASG
ncbi:MAG: putative bifunctional diguanylate cyclase/phosphodiesterase [Mycobacterium leprae]